MEEVGRPVPHQPSLVTFAGGPLPGRHRTRFLLQTSVRHLLPGTHTVFVRDPLNSLYQGPVLDDEGHGVRTAVRRRTAGSGGVVLLGVCGGAQAALRHGLTEEVNRVVLVSPLVGLEVSWRWVVARDYTVNFQVLPWRAWGMARPSLEGLLRRHPRVPVDVYYPAGYAPDVAHARRLERFPNVRMHPRDFHQHHLIKVMRESGELAQVLRDAVDEAGLACSQKSDDLAMRTKLNARSLIP